MKRLRKTSAGLTDVLTGEILDLTPLGRPPRNRYKKIRKSDHSGAWQVVAYGSVLTALLVTIAH